MQKVFSLFYYRGTLFHFFYGQKSYQQKIPIPCGTGILSIGINLVIIQPLLPQLVPRLFLLQP